jgi:hypothetical protein
VQEQARPPDAADAIAELERVNARGDAILRRMERLDAEVSRITARLDELAAGDPERFALLADKLANRLSVLITELMADAAHCEEARRQAEMLAPLLAFTPVMFEAAVAQGRQLEAEERDQAPRARPPRARHAKPRLTLVGGLAAGGAVAASLVAGGAMAVTRESAAVYPAAPRHAAVRLHAGRPDSAVLVPRPSPSSRPSAAVASASPAVTAVPSSPAPASVPASPPPAAPAVPVLSVPRLLDLGGSILGRLSLSAQGTGEVAWTATATDGIRLSSYAGEVVPGETVTLEVTDAPGDGGWVYVSFGGTVIPVEVTSGLGSPVLALSSGL